MLCRQQHTIATLIINFRLPRTASTAARRARLRQPPHKPPTALLLPVSRPTTEHPLRRANIHREQDRLLSVPRQHLRRVDTASPEELLQAPDRGILRIRSDGLYDSNIFIMVTKCQ